MGKAAMCIQMLQILNSGRIYKVSELADMLETNPRNIIEYKRELEEIGYYVVSVPGKFGGYRLDTTGVIPSLKLSQEEKTALTEGAGYLQARKDFLLKKDFQKAMAKIYSSIKNPASQPEPLVISRFPLAMQNDEIVARYSAIEKCVLKQYKVKIKYLSLKNEVTNRVIHPYKLFMYNNTWYTIGFDEKSNDFRYFKLNRIQSFSVLAGEKFRRLLSYNESDYFDEFGMKENGEWFRIKLRLYSQYAMLVQERVYGRNQQVEIMEDKSSILTCEMQNKNLIKEFVLSFGENCIVLEPEWLKEEIKNVITRMNGNF